MSDVPVEKKLELVQQVRLQHHQNQSDLMNREQILYGRMIMKPTENREYEIEGIFKDNTLKLRYAIAAILFIIIVLLDQTGHSIAGVSMDQVFAVLETDYEEALDAWLASNLSKKQ